jgi:hypothetical protein
MPASQHPFVKGQLAWLEHYSLQVHTVSASGMELKWVAAAERGMTHAVPLTKSFTPFSDLLALGCLVFLTNT